jgi:hypothetical protein
VEGVVHDYGLAEVSAQDVQVLDVQSRYPQAIVAVGDVLDQASSRVQQLCHLLHVVFLSELGPGLYLRSRENDELEVFGGFFEEVVCPWSNTYVNLGMNEGGTGTFIGPEGRVNTTTWS